MGCCPGSDFLYLQRPRFQQQRHIYSHGIQQKLQAQCLHGHSEARILRLQAEQERARIETYPDFEAGIGWVFRADSGMDPLKGEDFFMVSVGVQIPLFSHKKADHEVAALDAGIQTVNMEQLDMERVIKGGIYESLAVMDGIERQIELTRTTLVPSAELVLESSRAAYPVGKVDFLTLLSNEKRLIALRSHLVDLEDQFLKEYTKLNYLVGGIPSE